MLISDKCNFTDQECASVFYSSQTTPFYPQRGMAFLCIFDYSHSMRNSQSASPGEVFLRVLLALPSYGGCPQKKLALCVTLCLQHAEDACDLSQCKEVCQLFKEKYYGKIPTGRESIRACSVPDQDSRYPGQEFV